MYEVLTMVKQLGLSTFFMTSGRVDITWFELISIIVTLRAENMINKDIQAIYSTFFSRYSFLNPLSNNVYHHIETSQLICSANQLTGRYMMGNTGR